MYAYYVEVPRILKSGSNFQFIPPLEFLKNFQRTSVVFMYSSALLSSEKM